MDNIKQIISDFVRKLEIKQAEKQSIESSSDNLFANSMEEENLVSLSDNDEKVILSYLDEFKDYLIEEGYATTDILTESVQEILSASFVDGQLQLQNEQSEAEEAVPGETLNDVLEENDNLTPDETDDTLSGVEETDEIEDVEAISDTEELEENNGIQEEPQYNEIKIISLETFKLTNEQIDEYNNPSALLQDLYNDEDIISAIDSDSDGELSDEEMQKFESYIKFKHDKDELELEDIKDMAKLIKDGEFDIEEYESYEIPDEDKIQRTPDTQENLYSSRTGSTGGGGTYCNSRSFEDKLNSRDYSSMTLSELESIQDSKRSELENTRNILKSVVDGTDSVMASAQESKETSRNDYLKAVEENENIQGDLKESVAKNASNIANQESLISQKEVQIVNQQSQISQQNSLIAQDAATVAGLEAARGNLQSMLASASSTDTGKISKSDVSGQLASVNSQLSAANAQKAQHEAELAQMEADLANYEQEKGELEETLASLQEERDALQNQIMEVTHSEEIQAAFEQVIESENNYNELKEIRTSAAQKLFDDAQVDFNNFQTALNAKQQRTVENENSLGPSFDQLNEFLESLVGKSHNEMKKIIYEECGMRFDEGLYCGDFVGFALAQLYGGLENVPNNFSEARYWGCGALRDWGRQNGLLTSDVNQVLPGDIILFGETGASHTGLVVAVNSDGTVDTIEGNGVGGYVVHRKHVTGTYYINMGQYMRQ